MQKSLRVSTSEETNLDQTTGDRGSPVEEETYLVREKRKESERRSKDMNLV